MLREKLENLNVGETLKMSQFDITAIEVELYKVETEEEVLIFESFGELMKFFDN